MALAVTPAALVYTPVQPKIVTCARHVTNPEACLHGGITRLPADSSLVLDFGEELVGVLRLAVQVDTATTVELIEGEDLEEALLTKDPFPPEHWYHQPRDILQLQPGDTLVQTPGRRAFRYVNLLVHGPGELRLEGAQTILEHAPVKEQGSFACSDEVLNAAWQISRRTLRLCMQGFYEDGVKRDGMLWIGDYRVEFLCAWPLFGDTALARTSLRMFAQCRHPNGSLSAVALHAGGHLYPRISYLGDLSQPGSLHEWVLDNYCADFVCAVWEYVLHTGDTALADELAPALYGVLDYLATVDPAAGTPGRTFITDNQPEQTDWWGSRSALAFQLAAAFTDGAKLAELSGDTARAEQYRQLAGASCRNAGERYGDPTTGQCRDDTTADATRSWHTYAAAFLAGAISSADLRTLHPQLQSDPSVRRPMAGFMEFYHLEAWLEAGLVPAALDEMRAYYGQMLRAGATTTWELVDRREPGIDHIQPAGRSHCHGWSAGPAVHLPRHILGIAPTSPGYGTVTIKPNLGDLTWARGEIATPKGNIRISLSNATSSEVELPAGITATLHLPDREPVTLTSGRHTFPI
jgi:alpha-L-rhamnosidase